MNDSKNDPVLERIPVEDCSMIKVLDVLRHRETGKPVRMAFVSSYGDIIGNFGELSADIKRRQEMDAGFYL